jgi:membrane protein implicated in regulation of membrane protease activity
MMNSASFRLWAQAGAAVIGMLFAAGGLWVLWKGPWTLAVEVNRVDSIFYLAIGGLIIALVAVVALTEIKLNLKASKEGLTADLERDDEPAAAKVETTTTTTVTPGATA